MSGKKGLFTNQPFATTTVITGITITRATLLYRVLVDSNFEKIRSWSKIKSVSNVSFLHFVSAFFSDTIRLFISKITCTKVENGKTVCEGGGKTPCCTSYHDFEAFLRHFIFLTIINNFSTFFRRYVQPRKYFKKVGNLTISWPVFESEQKNSILIFYENFIFFSRFFCSKLIIF